MKNRKIGAYSFALIIAAFLTACSSNGKSGNSNDSLSATDKDEQNKERMMPDTTSNLLEYDSTKTKTGR